jgi:hypothetical protein
MLAGVGLRDFGKSQPLVKFELPNDAYCPALVLEDLRVESVSCSKPIFLANGAPCCPGGAFDETDALQRITQHHSHPAGAVNSNSTRLKTIRVGVQKLAAASFCGKLSHTD